MELFAINMEMCVFFVIPKDVKIERIFILNSFYYQKLVFFDKIETEKIENVV